MAVPRLRDCLNAVNAIAGDPCYNFDLFKGIGARENREELPGGTKIVSCV